MPTQDAGREAFLFEGGAEVLPKLVVVGVAATAKEPRGDAVDLVLDALDVGVGSVDRGNGVGAVQLDRIQQAVDGRLLALEPQPHGIDVVGHGGSRAIMAVEHSLELLEGVVAVVDKGLDLAGIEARVGAPVEERVGVGGLEAEMAEGKVKLTDAEGDVGQGTRGVVLNAHEEGPSKGIDGVDVLEGAGAVHGCAVECTTAFGQVAILQRTEMMHVSSRRWRARMYYNR